MPQTKSATTSSALLNVMMLLARSFSANLRKDNERLEPAQMGILMRLARGPSSLSELAKHMAVKPPTASRSVNILVNAGLVTRTVPAENRRMTLLALSPEGAKKLAHVMKNTEQHVSKLIKVLTDQERQQIDTALNILIKVLSS